MAEIHNDGYTAGDDQSKFFDKVRKLLAKAEDPTCTPEEAEALNAKAAELMAKYGIERAFAAAGRPGSDEQVIKEYDLDATFGEYEARLLAFVMMALRCKPILMARGTRVEVVGYVSDIERAEVLYTSLSLQMASGAARVRYAERTGFLVGFADTVSRRLRDAERRAADEAKPADGTPGTALVLQSREVAVRDAFAEAYPNVRNSRRRTVNASGYAAGVAAGQRANIGGTGVGGAGRRALAG